MSIALCSARLFLDVFGAVVTRQLPDLRITQFVRHALHALEQVIAAFGLFEGLHGGLQVLPDLSAQDGCNFDTVVLFDDILLVAAVADFDYQKAFATDLRWALEAGIPSADVAHLFF